MRRLIWMKITNARIMRNTMPAAERIAQVSSPHGSHTAKELGRKKPSAQTAHSTPSFPSTQVDPIFAVVVIVSENAAWSCTGSVVMTTLPLPVATSAALMVAAARAVVAFMDTSDTSCVSIITYVIVVPSLRRRRPASTVSTQLISHAPGCWWSVQITSLMACVTESKCFCELQTSTYSRTTSLSHSNTPHLSPIPQ